MRCFTAAPYTTQMLMKVVRRSIAVTNYCCSRRIAKSASFVSSLFERITKFAVALLHAAKRIVGTDVHRRKGYVWLGGVFSIFASIPSSLFGTLL